MLHENIDGELNFTNQLMEKIAKSHLDSNLADVTFVVDGVKLPAHKFILSMGSSNFEALVVSGSSESLKSEIELKVPLEAFKYLLRFIYTGRVLLREMNYQIVLDFLTLCHQYSIDELKPGIELYLMKNVSLQNWFDVFETARSLKLKELQEATLDFLDQNASKVLKTDEFNRLSDASLCCLLERSTFFVSEVDIFKAVLEWHNHNPNVDDNTLQTIISGIRFELIDLKDIFSVVEESSVLSQKRIYNVIKAKTLAKNLNVRCIRKPGINVATIEFNATVVCLGSYELLNGNVTRYDDKKGFAYHRISESAGIFNSITVQLGNIFMINKLDMLLWDKDNRSYFYYVEVSIDQKQWTRVIDHTKMGCRSWQILYFETQLVRYIKIVGTPNTNNEYFRVVHLAAFYQKEIPTLVNGLISPEFNVATKDKGAKVIMDGCSSNNTQDHDLLNGDDVNTCHLVGEQSIVIQLAQPYHIGSIRMLLWDKDDRSRTYSFYIETSTNQKDWKMAVDKRNEQLRSWQEFTFEHRPVVFFKITGTFKSVNGDGFHLVHFEAPNTYAKS